MVRNRMLLITVGFWASFTAAAWAQNFDSGSNGSYGSINCTVNPYQCVLHEGTPGGPVTIPCNSQQICTLDMPPDGIFHCTTITMAQSAPVIHLKFNRNPLNTPVYLLATGDVTIGGLINVGGGDGGLVGGVGGPSGFDGGTPGFGPEISAGAGHGPGAGGPGSGAGYGLPGVGGPSPGAAYGSSLLVPMVGGSGGGGGEGTPGAGGGGGGGAVLVASNTRITIPSLGIISARGGRGASCGSGGAIRLIAPVVSGTGLVDVRNCGNDGRIRVDTIDRRDLRLQFAPLSTTVISTMLIVFPDIAPRLDIVEVAGQDIPEEQPEPVSVLLPFDSSPNRTVTVQARDFTGLVPIEVVLTPDSGARRVYQAEINMKSGNPAQVVVPVEIPVNSITRVHAWTR